jgi:hypothetical protein
MFGWLYNLFQRREQRGLQATTKSALVNASAIGLRNSESFTSQNPIHFTVYKASGGHVVEFRHYDQKSDRHSGGLYIITDRDNFSDELGKLVMMECLSR